MRMLGKPPFMRIFKLMQTSPKNVHNVSRIASWPLLPAAPNQPACAGCWRRGWAHPHGPKSRPWAEPSPLNLDTAAVTPLLAGTRRPRKDGVV